MNLRLGNKKDEVETAKVVLVDDVRKSAILEMLTGERVGNTVCYSFTTLKRWWKEVAEVEEEVVEEAIEEQVEVVEEPVVEKKAQPKKARKQSGPTDEYCEKLIEAIENAGFIVKAYPSLRRCYSVRVEGRKNNLACMDIRRNYVKVYDGGYAGTVESFEYVDTLFEEIIEELESLNSVKL